MGEKLLIMRRHNMQKMTSVQARHQLCIIEHGKVKFTDIRVNPIIVRDFASSYFLAAVFPLKGTMISF